MEKMIIKLQSEVKALKAQLASAGLKADVNSFLDAPSEDSTDTSSTADSESLAAKIAELNSMHEEYKENSI